MTALDTGVLVPLDGSDKDSRALAAAEAVVGLTGSAARLMRVFDPPAASMSERTLTMGGLHVVQQRLAEASRSLGDAARRMSLVTGKEATAEIAEGFDVADVLLQRAAREDIAVVVMATRAATPPDRAFFGSVADRLMRECARPVVLVPPGADSTNETIRLGRVLIPLDGSRPSLAAADHMLALDHERALEYVLLEVVPESKVASGSLIDLADRLRAHGSRGVHVRIVEDADPAIAIRDTARTENVDFIAMSPRGLSGLQRFVLGSVTERVVRESRIPVFLLAED